MVNSFQDIITKFGGPRGFGEAIGMEPNTAKQAHRRNSLAPEWWGATIRAAQARGYGEITEARLIELAERRRTVRAA